MTHVGPQRHNKKMSFDSSEATLQRSFLTYRVTINNPNTQVTFPVVLPTF
jgi:hypothetical protein